MFNVVSVILPVYIASEEVYNISSTPPLFIEMLVQCQKSERSCIYSLEESIFFIRFEYTKRVSRNNGQRNKNENTEKQRLRYTTPTNTRMLNSGAPEGYGILVEQNLKPFVGSIHSKLTNVQMFV